ncbi:MAG: LysR family transcriptional regulator [Micrococcales bacterium]|nr:LysR family transcriptional regulator [Micrococcales bacterium]
MELDPRRLVVLAAVERAGGVAAAAAVLHVTSSAVSQQMVRLEREAGVALLVRTGRRVELTAAGTALAAHGRAIAEELQAATSVIAALTGAVTGIVTVVGFPTMIRAVLAATVADIAVLRPNLEVRVVDPTEDAGLAALQAGAADIVVLEQDAGMYSPAPSGTRDLLLLEDPYLLVLPAGWTLPGTSGGGWSAVVGQMDWISGPPGSAARSVLDRMAVEAGTAVRVVHDVLEFPSQLALVGAGLGAALVPQLALPPVEQHAAAGIRTVDLPGLGARRLVARHRQSRGEPGAAVRAVLEVLVARCAELVDPKRPRSAQPRCPVDERARTEPVAGVERSYSP